MKSITLDPPTLLLAEFLFWARQHPRVFATTLPMISYRGQSSADWPLLPSLCRANLPSEFLRQFEQEVIREVRARFNLSDWTEIDILAFARHHGAPTRLLDWSRNPLVALWFALSDKPHEGTTGIVFQLNLARTNCSAPICSAVGLDLAHTDSCAKAVHVISSHPRIERTDRQRSVFTIAAFTNDQVLQPLDRLLGKGDSMPIRKFVVPAEIKRELRRLLADLGLDPYSIYGDPDSFGKTLANQLDLSEFRLADETTPSRSNEGRTE